MACSSRSSSASSTFAACRLALNFPRTARELRPHPFLSQSFAARRPVRKAPRSQLSKTSKMSKENKTGGRSRTKQAKRTRRSRNKKTPRAVQGNPMISARAPTRRRSRRSDHWRNHGNTRPTHLCSSKAEEEENGCARTASHHSQEAHNSPAREGRTEGPRKGKRAGKEVNLSRPLRRTIFGPCSKRRRSGLRGWWKDKSYAILSCTHSVVQQQTSPNTGLRL